MNNMNISVPGSRGSRGSQGSTGLALLQVLMVVGFVVVMGFAMLSSSALKVQQSTNEQLAAEAETHAESGVNLAMYYLQYPARAPVLKAGYWPGGKDMALGSGGRGSADVTVVRDATDPQIYYVTSTGKAKAGASSAQHIARTVNAKLRVRPGLQVRHAVASGVDLSLGVNVRVSTGNVIVDGALSNFGVILNTAWARSFPVLGSILNALLLPPSAKVEVPGPDTIEKYETYVYADGRAYKRETLMATSVSGSTLGPSPNNPQGIFWAQGNFTVGDNVTINGTLIVEGDLIVNGSNVRITAPSGQPALIVAGDISTRSNRSMTVNGVTWIGGSIVGNGLLGSLLTTLNFNGALMFGGSGSVVAGGGSQINANAATTVDIRFEQARVNVPDMDRELARSVTILRWGR